MQRIPDGRAARAQLGRKFAFGLFKIELFERGTAGERIKKIAIEGEPRAVVDERGEFFGRIDERIERREQIRAEQHRAGVDVHLALLVDRAAFFQRLDRLLVQEFAHVAVFVHVENAVILAGFHILLKGNGRRAGRGRVDLQRIKQKQHVAREHKHALRNAGGHAAHPDHEFIEKRGARAVWQLARDGRKQLAARRILRHALAVAAGMDAQNALRAERRLPLADILQRVQRRAAAAHAQAVRIGQDGENRPLRQHPLFPPRLQLQAERFRLRFVGSGKNDVIPAREILAHKRAVKILPGVQIRLAHKQRIGWRHSVPPVSFVIWLYSASRSPARSRSSRPSCAAYPSPAQSGSGCG